MYPTSFPGLGHGRRAVSGAGSVTAADVGLILDCSGTFALTFAAAATLGNQFQVAFYVSSGTVTLTGNGAETIQSPAGSANTFVLTAGQGAYVSCDGTGLKIVLGVGLAPAPSGTITTDTIRAATTAGIVLQNSSGTQVASFGLSGTGVILAGTLTCSSTLSATTITSSTGFVATLGTITSAVTPASLSATWNNAAVTFNGYYGAFTKTAAGADSSVIRIDVGGSPSFIVQPDGQMVFAGGATAMPSSTYDSYGVIVRTGSGGSAPFDQAGSLLYRARLSATAGRSSHVFYTGASAAERFRINELGSIICGVSALATTATDGFLYVPTCAGTPTGTPTTKTGTAPIIVDTTNHKLYFYSGGSWRDAGP